MRVSIPHLARLTAAAVALAVAAATLGACAPAGSQSTLGVRRHAVLYHAFEPYPDIRVVPGLEYSDPDGAPLRLDICLPHVAKGTPIASRPAILSIHGGSWAYGDKAEVDWRNVCEWLASSGYVAASVDYRLAPGHPYPDAIRDVERAVEWLRSPAEAARFAIDPTLIGVFGGSAGGNLAALLGTSGSGSLATGHRVAAVAELSGPTNLTASGAERADFIPYELRYLGCRRLTDCPSAVAASPLFHVDASDPPFFIGQSTDERIPLSQSRGLVSKLRRAGIDVTFVTVKGERHSIALLDKGMRTRISTFFHAKLVHTLVGGAK